MNWYRIKAPFDGYTARDVGRLVLLEGTVREAHLQQMGYLELIGNAGDPPPEMVEYLDSIGPVMEASNPKPVGRRGRRGQQAEAGQDAGAVFSDAAGESARAGDVPQD